MKTIFKKINFESLHDDLRKVGLTLIIGAMTGLSLSPQHRIIPLSLLFIMGMMLWYLGLSDGENND